MGQRGPKPGTKYKRVAMKVGYRAAPTTLMRVYPTEINPKIDTVGLTAHLDDLHSYVMAAMALMEKAQAPSLAEHMGRYGTLASRMIEFRGKMLGGAVRPGSYGNLNQTQVDRLRQEFADTLSLQLAQLKALRDYAASEKAEALKEDGQPSYWVANGPRLLLTGMFATITKFAELVQYEQIVLGTRDVIGEAYGRVINASFDPA